MKSSTINKQKFSYNQIMALVSIKNLRSLPCSELNVFSNKQTISSLAKRGFIIHENEEIKLSPEGREIVVVFQRKYLTPLQRLALYTATISLRHMHRIALCLTEMKSKYPNFKPLMVNTITP